MPIGAKVTLRGDKMFEFFDRTNNGTIDIRNLPKAMRSMGALITNVEIVLMIKKFDPDKTRFIKFTDF